MAGACKGIRLNLKPAKKNKEVSTDNWERPPVFKDAILMPTSSFLDGVDLTRHNLRIL